MPRTLTTDQFAKLPSGERKKLVDQGWDIIKWRQGRWTSRKPRSDSLQISEIVEAKKDTLGVYGKGKDAKFVGIKKGTKGRFVGFSATEATIEIKGKPNLGVSKKHFKPIRKEYRTIEGIWGKKSK